MKITQGQVTIAMGLVAVGVVYFVGKKAINAAGSAVAGVGDALSYGVQQITPWNPDNVVNRSVNKVGGALVSDPMGPGKNADGSWTLGGWVYDTLWNYEAHKRDQVASGTVYNSTRINSAAAADAARVDAAIAAQQAAVGGATGYYDQMGNYVGTW